MGVLSLLLGFLLFTPAYAQEGNNPTTRQLLAQASDGPVRVLVRLNTAATGFESQSITAQQATIQQLQAEIATELVGRNATILQTYNYVPYISIEADAAAIRALLAQSEVVSVTADRIFTSALASSTEIVRAPIAWENGIDGAGYTVAVIDSGVDADHPFFNGRVVEEACFSRDLCPNGQPSQIGPGAASPAVCNGVALDCFHGTHVAGIIAGDGPDFDGVARAANIIAINSSSTTFNSSLLAYFESDLLASLEYVYDLRNTYQIAAVNMSLGGSLFSEDCDAVFPAFKEIIDRLLSVGIVTVIAAGNGGAQGAVSTPGCISSAITVASANDFDNFSNFTNFSDQVELIGPGENIISSIPGGGFGPANGTSFATPHIAGAYALLRQANPTATPAELTAVLANTGVGITNTTLDVTRPRIDIAAALGLDDDGGTPIDECVDGIDTVGVFETDQAIWQLNNTLTAAPPAETFQYGLPAVFLNQFGLPADTPVVGDWNGDGTDTVAIWRQSVFFLQDSGPNGGDLAFWYGQAGDIPIAGDWNGDGTDTVGLWRGGVWLLRNTNATGVADISFPYGIAGDVPVVGDWDGDGDDTVGVWRNGTWLLRNDNIAGPSDEMFAFGIAGDVPVVGDWDGDCIDTAGVYRNGRWLLTNDNQTIANDFIFQAGAPVIGNWDGDVPAPAPTNEFLLLNAADGQVIQTLTSDTLVNLSTLPDGLAITADFSKTPGVESVVFDYQGVANFRTEDVEPYALTGDRSGRYNPLALAPGEHSITATAYLGRNGTGTVLDQLDIQFTVVAN